MANPFYVQPGNSFGQGLQALAQTVGQTGEVMRQREQQQKQEAYQAEAKQALAEALQSGDPRQVQQAVVNYPELSQVARDAFGITNAQTEAIAKDTYSRLLADPDPARALQYLDAGIQQVAAAGGNPINMVKDYAMFKVDPASALKRIQLIAPAFGLGGQQDDFGKYNPRDYTSESWAAFVESRNPADLVRYETSLQERLAANPDLTTRVAGAESQIAGEKSAAAETGKLQVQQAMVPKLQAEIAKQVEAVKRESASVQAFEKKANDARGVNDIIEMATPLLDKATASLGGVILDSAGALIGLSNDGAEAAAQLKALEGALILKMPRMEGPQSDRDSALYRQMAAQIGDATVPSKIRKAALETLKELNDKYTGQQTSKTGEVNWGDL